MELEESLGAVLFEKQGAGRLTPFGEVCVPRFRELLGVHDRVVKDLDDVVNRRSGRVEVVTAPSIARRYMPSVLNDFLRKYPALEIGLHDGPADVVADMVRTGEVEFGVSALWADAEDLEFEPILEDAVGVVCHQTHSLADANSLRWQDLIGQTMIRNGTSRLLEATPAGRVVGRESDLYFRDDFYRRDAGDWHRLHDAASAWHFRTACLTLRFIPIKNPTVTRVIGIITRRGVTVSPAAQTVIGALRQTITAEAHVEST